MLRGPRYFNTDVALLKVTTISQTIGLQFRAEFFNIFNNVGFNAPNSNVASAQFGRITSALDPRIIQFGVKLLFWAWRRGQSGAGVNHSSEQGLVRA